MKSRIPRPLSPGECAFALHCRAENLTPEREYMFHPGRKWRIDFAFLNEKIGVEIEGGTWIAGGHNRGKIYELNLIKYNEAAKLGWRVMRYTTNMVTDGTAIADVLEMLGLSPCQPTR